MGVLRGTKSGTLHHLPSRAVVGRASTCRLQLDEQLASAEHASVAWTGGCWEVRDLASTNGTFVDGRQLEAGATAVLLEGTRVGFGGAEGFVLIDASEPQPIAKNLAKGIVVAGEGGLLALPTEANPAASIYRSETEAWTLELEGETQSVGDQAIVTVLGEVYQLDLPETTEATPMVVRSAFLDAVELCFFVDRTEENVALTVRFATHDIELEARDHLYVLLVLARLREAEGERPSRERGWVDRDELLKMLALSENAFNVAVHRARKQLVQAGIEDGARVVQTRRSQRRLGTDRFQIVTENA